MLLQPDITVLIPNFNGSQFLDSALRSLLQQSYKNFVVFIVDDGSVDDSLQRAKFFQKALSIQIFELQNVGITANWNRAIDKVETPYFTLLHFDDEYEPEYLEKMRSLISSYENAAIAHCVATTIDENSKKIHSPVELYKKHRFFPEKKIRRNPVDEFHLLMQGDYINCPSVMFKTCAVKTIGLFNKDYEQVQDWEYWFRVLLSGFEICATNESLFRYRRHGDNASQKNSKNLKRYREEHALLEWAFSKGRDQGWIDQETINFSLLLKTGAVDIANDLTQSKNLDAMEKLDELKSLIPNIHSYIEFWVLKALIPFGKYGGKALQLGLSCMIYLFRYLPPKRVK